jgi:hypothetical protein
MSVDDELINVLRNARVTLDPDRSTAKACILCHTVAEPRDLVQIGTYTRHMGGGIRPGDAIERPMCARCREKTNGRATEPHEFGHSDRGAGE